MKEEILRFSFCRTGGRGVLYPVEDGPADFTELLKGVKRIFTNEREKPLTLLF